MAEGFLDRIVAATRARLDRTPADPDLAARALDAVASRRDSGLRSLHRALTAARPAVIAECKRASPSAGVLRENFDPVALATAYGHAGAAAISVVTEPEHFLGDLGWVGSIREAVELPVLRKDFILETRQLREAAIAGADAVLLINRILEPGRLAELLAEAERLSLEVVLEIFADESPDTAVASGARVIGVNARDLATFAVDLDAVAGMAAAIPPDRVRVAESGIRSRDDLERLQDAGYDAFLVGERLVRAADPGAALGELLGRPPDEIGGRAT